MDKTEHFKLFNKEATLDLLNEWKKQYNQKNNELECQKKDFAAQLLDIENEIKTFKSENRKLLQALNVTRNDNYLEIVKKFKEQAPIESKMLAKLNSTSGNFILKERFLNTLKTFNLFLDKRNELQNTLMSLQKDKNLLERKISQYDKESSAALWKSELYRVQTDFENMKIKYDEACYVNQLLKEFKEKLENSNNDDKHEIERNEMRIYDLTKKIEKLRGEISENQKKRFEIEKEVAEQELQLYDRKVSREEFAIRIGKELEESKFIDINQIKGKPGKENFDENFGENVSKTVLSLMKTNIETRNEENNFEHLRWLYDLYLNAREIGPISDPKLIKDGITELKDAKEELTKLLNNSQVDKDILMLQLKDIEEDFFKKQTEIENQNELDKQYEQNYKAENNALEKQIETLGSEKIKNTMLLNKIMVAVSSICKKVLDSKRISSFNISKSSSIGRPSSRMSQRQKSEIPSQILEQLDLISDMASNLLNDAQSLNFSGTTKLVNLVQNSYLKFDNDAEVLKPENDNQRYSLNLYNEYLSRSKLKMHSNDLINRSIANKTKQPLNKDKKKKK